MGLQNYAIKSTPYIYIFIYIMALRRPYTQTQLIIVTKILSTILYFILLYYIKIFNAFNLFNCLFKQLFS
jgi:hypothetical protein